MILSAVYEKFLKLEMISNKVSKWGNYRYGFPKIRSLTNVKTVII